MASTEVVSSMKWRLKYRARRFKVYCGLVEVDQCWLLAIKQSFLLIAVLLKNRQEMEKQNVRSLHKSVETCEHENRVGRVLAAKMPSLQLNGVI